MNPDGRERRRERKQKEAKKIRSSELLILEKKGHAESFRVRNIVRG
jgi:hypothetical protein